ncbi:MAG: PP2C family protein-serine/threonine phosphatase [Bacillota bacterium]
MQVTMAVAKVPKFGLSESGDSVEIVERPRGGITAILADGQTHGRAAKRVSQIVVAKAVQLIADGIRDGAVARGVHDYLYAVRDGKVSTELVMISVDTRTKSLVIARNTHVPVLLRHADGRVERLEAAVEPVGIREVMKPVITEVPLEAGVMVAAFTDGIFSAGRRYEAELELDELIAMLAEAEPNDVQRLADRFLSRAVEADRGRPGDDMSVVTVGLAPRPGGEQVRRMSVTMPF